MEWQVFVLADGDPMKGIKRQETPKNSDPEGCGSLLCTALG